MSSIMDWTGSLAFQWAGQIGLGSLVFLVLCSSPVKAFVVKLPWAHLLVLAFLFSLMLLGQCIGRSRLIYPMLRWDMYSINGDYQEVTSSVMIGITEHNERVRLSIPELFPIVHFILPPSSDPMLEKIVQTAAKAYNLNHPDAPVVKVEVGTMTVPIGAPKEPEWNPSEMFTVGSAPSKS